MKSAEAIQANGREGVGLVFIELSGVAGKKRRCFLAITGLDKEQQFLGKISPLAEHRHQSTT